MLFHCGFQCSAHYVVVGCINASSQLGDNPCTVYCCAFILVKGIASKTGRGESTCAPQHDVVHSLDPFRIGHTLQNAT